MRRPAPHWILITSVSTVIAVAAYFLQQHLEYKNMYALPADLKTFDVNGPIPSCGRWKDTMPKDRDAAAYLLYIKARRLWHSKIAWQLTRLEFNSIFRDVQTAANKGDWGARALLAHFYRSGLGPLQSNHVLDVDPHKSVEIVRTAVAAGQAWGFYDLGVAHEHGYGGAIQDEKIAWAYYLKAAELGSPEAQMTLGSAYLKVKRWDAEEAMVMCAFRQGHGPAAYDLGIIAEGKKNFAKALEYYQAGTRFGNQRSAAAMMLMFDFEEWSSRDKQDQEALKELDIIPDAERKRRYKEISQALDINPDLRLNLLDRVLPLPPAELPPWRGIQDTIAPEPDAPPSY